MKSLLTRIPIAHRPLLIVGALCLPLLGLFYFMLAGFGRDIEFARMELRGTEYQRPLQELLRLVPHYEWSGTRAGGRADEREEAVRKIERAFDALEAVDRRHGVALQFTADGLRKRGREAAAAARLRGSWSALRDRTAHAGGPAAADPAAVAALLNDLRTAITHLGDTSNLILDPDLDSYYLMDATVVALPSLQHRLVQVINAVRQESGYPATAAAVHGAQIGEVDAGRAVSSLRTALAEDANFHGTSPGLRTSLNPALEKLNQSTEVLLARLQRRAAQAEAVPSAAEIESAAFALRTISFEVWTVAARELDALLARRIADLQFQRTEACLVVLACGALAGLVFWWVSRSIVTPIQQLTATATQLSQGDLSAVIPLTSQPDEAGALARAMRGMTENLKSVLSRVSHGVGVLAASSQQLSTASEHTAGAIQETTAMTGSLAAAAEEMSTNAVSVAAGVEQASTNLGTVAGAAAQMSVTIGEVVRHSERGREITRLAVEQTTRIRALIDALSQSAETIGKVTETITTISNQTNLLALNATIESARAGAAGRGFAVVAHEIKELARQTAAATNDIRARVEGIQQSTRDTANDLGGITEVVGRVGEVVDTIATAIEEQNLATRDIARNVAEATQGVRDANERVAQISASAQSVTRDLAKLKGASDGMTSSSSLVLNSVGQLSDLAGELGEAMGQFRLDGGRPGAGGGAAHRTAPRQPRHDSRGLHRSVTLEA